MRNRNKGIIRVKVSAIQDAKSNIRKHPRSQTEAMVGVVDEIGWYGYPDVYTDSTGVVRLCDGHFRKSFLISRYGPDTEIEVNMTDFNEDDAKRAMLTKDPLTLLSEFDTDALERVIDSIKFEDAAVNKLITDMAVDAGIESGEAQYEFHEDQIDWGGGDYSDDGSDSGVVQSSPSKAQSKVPADELESEESEKPTGSPATEPAPIPAPQIGRGYPLVVTISPAVYRRWVEYKKTIQAESDMDGFSKLFSEMKERQ